MGTVEGVAGLERDRLLPAAVHDQASGLGRAHHATRERARVLDGREGDRSADQLGALVRGPQARAGVIGAVRAVDGLDEGGLVPVVGAAVDLEDAEGLAVRAERDLRAVGARGGFGVGDREDDRDGPGPLPAVPLDGLLGEHRVIVCAGHGTLQRRERAVRDAVEGGAVHLVHVHLREVGSGARCGGVDAVDGGVEATVDGEDGSVSSSHVRGEGCGPAGPGGRIRGSRGSPACASRHRALPG